IGADYYTDKGGKFYQLREGAEGKELVQDLDAQPVSLENIGDRPPEKLVARSKPEPPPRNEPLAREASEDPTLKWAEISDEKKFEMVDRARRSELYHADTVDDFVGRAQEVTSTWDDQSKLMADLATAHENLLRPQGRFETEVQAPLKAVLEKLG